MQTYKELILENFCGDKCLSPDDSFACSMMTPCFLLMQHPEADTLYLERVDVGESGMGIFLIYSL